MEKKNEQPFPPLSTNPRVHEESAMSGGLHYDSQQASRKRRTKVIACAGVFIVLQTAIILAVVLVLFRVKTPGLRITSVVENSVVSGPTGFNGTVVIEVAIRNRNYGKYKYETGTIGLTYKGIPVGQGTVFEGSVKARKTRRVNVRINVSYAGTTDASRVLTIQSAAKLKGKVHVLKVMKKGKTAEMNCSMALNLDTSKVQYLKCD